MGRMAFIISGIGAAIVALVWSTLALADPADVNAAARGVVRVVIIGTDGVGEGAETYPISHGSGFAISSRRIVTNAHVVRDAAGDDSVRIGIVPSQGDRTGFARIVAVSPRNDLALLEIVGNLRLPPLTISGDTNGDSGEVSAVGYPMNVDQAQGLDIADIFRAQPPVKSRGFLSGVRPSRQFDTILHTAPIARGNSGGPLLDGCGRVLGVNSFGADSGGSDAEFFFAVSTRELLPFLRANGVEAQVNGQPCRSLAELDAAERAEIERAQVLSRAQLAKRSEESRSRRARVQLEAEQSVREDRENAMALAFVLVLVSGAAGLVAWRAYNDEADRERTIMIAGTVSAIALVAALALWFTRPGIDAIDRKVNAAMAEKDARVAGRPTASASAGALSCTLDAERSRITGSPAEALTLEWTNDGCVNGRTQYGFSGGSWSRVFVPNSEDAVAVNRYDPETRIFRTDRYLLGSAAMAVARSARSKYTPPQCANAGAAAKLGDLQGAVTASLPPSPNERLTYRCAVEPN